MMRSLEISPRCYLLLRKVPLTSILIYEWYLRYPDIPATSVFPNTPSPPVCFELFPPGGHGVMSKPGGV